MLEFEDSDVVIRPRGEGADHDEADDSRRESERVEDAGDGEDSEADLRLHEEH